MCFKWLYERYWHGEEVGNEFITYQFRRLAKARPVFFWGAAGTVATLLGLGFSGSIWFILHIIGVV